MSEHYVDILEEVKNDRSSGAWVVAQRTIDCLQALSSEKAQADAGELISEVERVAAEILKAQPGMAQLIHLFNSLFQMMEQASSSDTLVLSRKIAGEATRFDENCVKAVTRVAEIGAELIAPDSVVLIHSNSSTVYQVLKKAHDDSKSFQVILTESRPMCEGRTCAERLSQLGIQCLYLIDAAISKGVERADIVLLGADSLSENSLVNKVGAKAISLLAREAVIPCYTACESSKFMPQKLSLKKEVPRDPSEVWKDAPADINIENYYFDIVPLDLFTGVITEEGVLTPTEVGGRIRAQKLHPKILEMLK